MESESSPFLRFTQTDDEPAASVAGSCKADGFLHPVPRDCRGKFSAIQCPEPTTCAVHDPVDLAPSRGSPSAAVSPLVAPFGSSSMIPPRDDSAEIVFNHEQALTLSCRQLSTSSKPG